MNREEVKRWKDVTAAYLHPLRSSGSEMFVQDVMRKVRAYEPSEGLSRWPFFARWAIPALALSMSSFAATLVYTLPPAAAPTDLLLADAARSGPSSDWTPGTFNEDQILGLSGEAQ